MKKCTDGGNIEEATEYTYNDDGIRVGSFHAKFADGDPVEGSVETTFYLVDSRNHTGYAQVLEELTYDYAWVDPAPLTDPPTSRKTYTIGDDVITQHEAAAGPQHLLYDGHGSTRQLSLPEEADNRVEISALYSYDAYGVMLGGNPTREAPAATDLLYIGEQFDIDAQQYYLRVRYYDPLNGRFNRADPFAGNQKDLRP